MRSFALLFLVLAACGGDGGGAPIQSGSISASYKGTTFTPKFGFATVADGSPLIGLATSGVDCGSENSSSPPSGRGVIISGFTYTTATFDDAVVQVFENTGGSYTAQVASGTLTLTDVNDATIAGSVTLAETTDTDETYSASGDFVIERCPE